MLAHLVWDPDRNLFILPYLNHPVTWYGFLFATGFLLSYFIVRKLFTNLLSDPSKTKAESELEAVHFTDRLAIFIVIGGILGARLGHVFFYDWSYYKMAPVDIFKIWEGGLASHGGALGALVALFIFVLMSRKKAPQLHFLAVLDIVVIPTALTGALIRVGNFINQEITGIPTTQPWGVIFRHPIDGIAGVPLHPVQLYEAFFYLFTCCLLALMWMRRKKDLGLGLLSGWFFVLVFGFRFVIEYFKMPQNQIVDVEGLLRMGQWLSLPFILWGIYLLIRYHYVKKKG